MLVEFLMPAAFLDRTPDQLTLKLAGGSRTLGCLHSVVIRLRERIVQPWDVINLEEWKEIARRIDRNCATTVHWMDDAHKAPTVATCQGLVALRFLPNDALLDIVNLGFPFIAWLRSDPKAGWKNFEERLEAWARALPLNRLASHVHAIRGDVNDVGSDMTLLWDDPDQIGHWQLDDVSTGDL